MNDLPFRKLAIVGAGQVGTSVAMAAALAQPRVDLVAYDPAPIGTAFRAAMRRAGARDGAVGFSNDPAVTAGADLVVLATPIGSFGVAVRTVAPHLGPGAVVTDVGSVKGLAQRRIRRAIDRCCGKGVQYVPFHILNGNAGRGPATAAASVLRAPGVLVPGQASPEAERRIDAFWRSVVVQFDLSSLFRRRRGGWRPPAFT